MKQMKRIVGGTILSAGLVATGLVVSKAPAQQPNTPIQSQSEIQRGFAIAPVQLNLRGKNPALVGLGSYLVNAVGGCNDCHTCPSYTPGQSPYASSTPGSIEAQVMPGAVNATNYLAGGVPFTPTPFISRNITPDASGKPAGLTLQQFMQVMRTGVDLDNEHPGISPLLQVMPWPVFRHMTDNDLSAIYAYLSAIPHAEPGNCFAAGQ
jgi:hypothetical protein